MRDGKKRIMPRHLMNAAIATGIIPYKIFIAHAEEEDEEEK